MRDSDETSKKTRTHSMRGLMLMLMWGLILCVVLVFLITTLITQIIPSLNDVAFRTLHNHAAGNATGMSAELTAVSRSARQYADTLETAYNTFLYHSNGTWADIDRDEEALDLLFSYTYDEIVSFISANAVTGAFVILDVSYTGTEKMAALYLRDPTPGSGMGTDLTMLRGPTRLTGATPLPLEKSWSYEQDKLTEDDGADFYTKPEEAVALYPKADSRDWGYWSDPFRLSDNDIPIITFTTPLLDASMNVVGVFGVEYSLQYFSRLMPTDNLPFDEGFFLVGKNRGYTLDPAEFIASTPQGNRYLFERSQPIQLDLYRNTRNYQVWTEDSTDLYVSYASMDLYGRNSPYAGEQYTLYALAPKDRVLQSARSITAGIAASLVASIMVAVLAALLFSRMFASRIEKLAEEVRSSGPEQPLHLQPTNIREIDSLVGVLSDMSNDIIRYAARMSTIVDLVGIPMGAFEIQERQERVFLTDSLYRLLEIERPDHQSAYMDMKRFLDTFPTILVPQENDVHTEQEIQWNTSARTSDRWLRVRLLRRDQEVYGTMIDISDEVLQKKRLAFERDYDPLTSLLNRNSYPARMNSMIDGNPDCIGVLLFGDLDNLKYINDTFGHDMGDRYIQMAATALKKFERIGGAVARISGDEFVVYLHDGNSREELRIIVDKTLEQIRAMEMPMPDESVQKVRISVGLAYYPGDADNIDTLIKYADFAMYEIKHSAKGGTLEFSAESYEKNSFILRKPNHLDILLESRRMRFAFQPIIDVRTGEVFAYEALMRPMMRELHTPGEVLMLAKKQSKLYQIELLTVSTAFEWLKDNHEQLGNRRLFVNLIANQHLSPEDMETLKPLLEKFGDRVVMEFTEGEYGGEEVLKRKVISVREIGGKIAIDDYGSGYNGELSLLSVSPDYIKMDMSIVRNIDKDPKRQKLMQQVVEYAETSNSVIISEGVETPGELETVIRLGTRYVQGFYLGRPEYELDRHSRSACELTRQYYLKASGQIPEDPE